jgi:hypothetical protein
VFALQQQEGGSFTGTVAAPSFVEHTFTVPSNARFTFVQLDWDGAVGETEIVIDNTNVAINDLALSVRRGSQTVANSDSINLAALFGSREAVKIEFPAAGAYTARVSSGLAGLGQPLDQPYRITVTHYVYNPADVFDTQGMEATTRDKVLRLVYDRIMSAEGGAFRPDAALTRMELARAVMLGARVMQFIPASPSFGDLTAGTPESLFAESLKREGLMGLDGPAFNPAAQVSRLEAATALVRALRLDSQAKALANTTVKFNGQPLVDNAQIPGALRGYVQIAIDRGVFEALPAQVVEVAPGQFQAVPGPRFEPGRAVKRIEFVDPILKVVSIMFGE